MSVRIFPYGVMTCRKGVSVRWHVCIWREGSGRRGKQQLHAWQAESP